MKVAFFDRALKSLSNIELRVPTGAAGMSQRQRMTANDYGFQNAFTHFVLYEDDERGDVAWTAYKITGRSPSREVVGRFPTMEAAEMWLVHCA